MSGLAPSGELKRDIAVNVIGAFGLIALRRSDQLGLVYGNQRGSGSVPTRRGETHVESLCDRFYFHSIDSPGPSDIVSQLHYAATFYRRRMLIIIVSDEPDADDRLAHALEQLSERHDLMWVLISDMPIIGSSEEELDGYDVNSGEFVINGATLGPRVIAAYRESERARLERLDALLTERAIRYTRIGSSNEIRGQLVSLTQDFRHAQ